MTLATGTVLHNRYRIVRLVGQGGFGAVYRGWDTALEQPVAVKEQFDTGPESQRQFKREARLLAGLRHANLPVVIDHFILPGQGQYLVMDFIEGQSLGAMLVERGRPLDEAEVLPWIRQVCGALEYLHSRQPPVIHRDIKPQNIIVTDDGRAVLVDFGISKEYDPNKGTTIGAKAVTPGFSPPEQYGRGRTDPRSDVYALGATLYAMLTAQIPPEAPDLSSGADVLIAPRQINPVVSEAASAAVVAAMATAISQRVVSAGALRTMLPSVGSPLPTPSKAAPVPLGQLPALGAANPRGKVRSIPKWVWVGGLIVLIGLAVWAAMTFGEPSRGVETTITQGATPNATTAAATPQPTKAPIETRKVLRGEVEVEQVFIPAGSFNMGSTQGGAGYENEQPVHLVELDSYWIDRTEVTNSQYQECDEAGVCDPPADTSSNTQTSYYGNSEFDDFPVIFVSWNNASAFCEWADGRLPTEAEWEYAARGRNVLHYPWGKDYPKRAWANLRRGESGDTVQVGRTSLAWKDLSPFEVWGMTGNVREWVSDRFGSYQEGRQTNPQGDETGTFRVVKGGSWRTMELWSARLAVRGALQPNISRNYIGLRCVQK